MGKILNKCTHCDKTSYSIPGLKGHITKMHRETLKTVEGFNVIDELNVPKEEHAILISQEANKVVNELLNDIIYINDDEGNATESDEASLEELADNKSDKVEMKYINKCENCDYEAKADKKYLALQLLLNHKDSCCVNKMKKIRKTTKCNQCDFIMNESSNMKRHMRDAHEVKTDSTSPPPKKKKPILEELNDNIEDMDTETSNLEDLSFKLDEMEIDNEEKELVKERSRKMDEKIKDKARISEEKEAVLQTKRSSNENKKRQVAEIKAETAIFYLVTI